VNAGEKKKREIVQVSHNSEVEHGASFKDRMFQSHLMMRRSARAIRDQKKGKRKDEILNIVGGGRIT